MSVWFSKKKITSHCVV